MQFIPPPVDSMCIYSEFSIHTRHDGRARFARYKSDNFNNYMAKNTKFYYDKVHKTRNYTISSMQQQGRQLLIIDLPITWFLYKNVFDVLTDLMYGRSNIVPIIGTLRKKLTATGKKPL